MDQKLVFLIVAIVALAAVAITTAIMSVSTPAQALNCGRLREGCHGCSNLPGDQGYISSEGKCFGNP